jgi:predicted histone-like DNA-binding protein
MIFFTFAQSKKYLRNKNIDTIPLYPSTDLSDEPEIHTADIAERIQKNSSFSKGSVVGVIDDFIQEMIISMHDSHTVVIDGLGRFYLTVESEGVNNPQSFRIDRDIKKVRCRFLPAGKRNIDGRVTSKLSENVEVEWLPENK